ncbi:MAG: DNA polymerase III subunit gamma/tau [Clostridiaceae bacterium]|nr:DNA polymerase III subunit gamma/tau [Clostridiaceae bacterium]
MSRIALYREWRPRNFDQVVEQRHTVAALRQSVVSGNISHAYLFSGTRGTGKTTLAQLFSRAINCLNPQDGNPCNECDICKGILDGSLLDVVEVDAASNNSVDNIRRICDEVQFLPTLARYKVYIVDEVHMLSPGAFNALLKTLEEPPAHAVFILATTDPHRIPSTIVSRCQRYDFHRIPVAGIVGRLREISDADGIRVTDDALEAVATLSDGALRDAISLLDQCRATFVEEITRDDVLSLAGVVNDTFMYDMGCAMAARDAARAMELTDAMILDGRDVVRFTSDLAAYYRDIMMCQVSTRPDTLVRASSEAIQGMRTLAGRYRLDTLLAIVRDLSELLSNLRWAPDPRTLFEITLIRIMQTARTESDDIQTPETRGTANPIPTFHETPVAPPVAKATLVTAMPQSIAPVAPPAAKPNLPTPPPLQDTAPAVPKPEPPTPVASAPSAPASVQDSPAEEMEEPVPPEADDLPEVWEEDAYEPSPDFPPSQQEEDASDLEDLPEVTAPDPQPEPERSTPPSAPTLSTDTPAHPMEAAAPPAGAVALAVAQATDAAAHAADAAAYPSDVLHQAWEDMLTTLCNSGQMVLYLYLRPARVRFDGGLVTVYFTPEESANQTEVTRKGNDTIIKEALAASAGGPVELVIRTDVTVEAPAAQTTWKDAEWVRKVRRSADDLGIPFTYNE